jgi:hypothetical protein
MKNLIEEQGVPYMGKGHSLIISYGSAGAKPVHIHGTYPEYCGVMLLTEGLRVMTPVHQEMVFQPGVMACHEFAELLCSQANAVGEELETSMAKKCSESPTVAKLIQECGYLLATTSREARSRQEERSLAHKPLLALAGMEYPMHQSGPKFDKDGVLYVSTYAPQVGTFLACVMS